MSTVDIAAELQAVGGGSRRLHRPGPAAHLRRRARVRPAPAAGDPGRRAAVGATYPADEVDHRAGPPRRPDPDRRTPARRTWSGWRCSSGSTAPTRTRSRRRPSSRSQAVKPAGLRTLHAERVHPAGAILVLVGDIKPDKAIDQVAAALGRLDRRRQGRRRCRRRRRSRRVRSMLVDRPGSVQSSMRLALPAVGRTHPDFPALQLANLVFGGYFSSRWVENIREDKGYTYSPHSAIEHSIAGSHPVAADRRGDRGDRARRCWRPGTSWVAWPRLAPEATRSWSRPASTRSARCCSACRPRPASPGWRARMPATVCGLDYPRRLLGRAGRGDRRRGRRRGREVPGAVGWCDRDPRRRGEGRSVAGRARPGGAGGIGVTEPTIGHRGTPHLRSA